VLAHICITVSGNGRESLPIMVRENQKQYWDLTDEERALLVEEFDAEKPSAPVPRLTSRAKVNDAKHTINRVEREV
jgi:hypothetical protein